MHNVISMPGAATPMERRATIDARLGVREGLTLAITELIDLLDQIDGDPDIEANGDERDGTAAEDDFYPHSLDWFGHPGCPIADPDCGADDHGEAEGGI